jgi:hypothetical protein
MHRGTDVRHDKPDRLSRNIERRFGARKSRREVGKHPAIPAGSKIQTNLTLEIVMPQR